MTDPVTRLARAEAEAVAAREHLHLTLASLQTRLEPKRLARDTARELGDASGVAARRTIDAARRNPSALAGIVAVAGLFLARHRLGGLIRRPGKATRDADAS